MSALVDCDEAVDLLPKQGLPLTPALKHKGRRWICITVLTG